jgi:hypothetical protein
MQIDEEAVAATDKYMSKNAGRWTVWQIIAFYESAKQQPVVDEWDGWDEAALVLRIAGVAGLSFDKAGDVLEEIRPYLANTQPKESGHE